MWTGFAGHESRGLIHSDDAEVGEGNMKRKDGYIEREKGQREVASCGSDERNSCRELPFWLRQCTRPTHLCSIVRLKCLSLFFPGGVMMKSNSGDTSLATRNLPTPHAQPLPSTFVLLPTTTPCSRRGAGGVPSPQMAS